MKISYISTYFFEKGENVNQSSKVFSKVMDKVLQVTKQVKSGL